jgi:hypothetical protein
MDVKMKRIGEVVVDSAQIQIREIVGRPIEPARHRVVFG